MGDQAEHNSKHQIQNGSNTRVNATDRDKWVEHKVNTIDRDKDKAEREAKAKDRDMLWEKKMRTGGKERGLTICAM